MHEAIKMRQFINEYSYSTGRYASLADGNLPDVPTPLPTVVMPKERVVEFRNNYLLLIRFASLYCGVPEDKLCPLDLMAPFLRQDEEDEPRN